MIGLKGMAVLGLVALLLGGALWVQSARLKSMAERYETSQENLKDAKSKLENVVKLNADNIAEIAKRDAEIARLQDVAAEAERGNKSRDNYIAQLRRNLRHVDPEDDGPVAPVLCTALDGVRHAFGATGPACRGAAPVGDGANPAVASGVRAPPS